MEHSPYSGDAHNMLQIHSSPSSLAILNTTSGDGRRRKRQGGLNLKCNWPGCSSESVFRRKYELERHMLKHTGQDLYPCTAICCDRHGTKSFKRADKFREHVRNHPEGSLFSCPDEHCSLGPFSLASLVVHVWDSHGCQVYTNQGMEYVWATMCLQKACPIQGCRKPFRDISSLQEHLKQHERRDIVAQSHALELAGFNPTSCGFVCLICTAIWRVQLQTT